MSPTAQHMTIAKACGWDGFEDSVSPEFPPIGVPPQHEMTERLLGPRKITNWTPRFDVPDYTKDLNVCGEFENVLKEMGEEKCEEYLCELDKVITGQICWKVSEADHWACATATAAQRSEAFLRTIEKWDDSK